jgi:hypothetical protein
MRRRKPERPSGNVRPGSKGARLRGLAVAGPVLDVIEERGLAKDFLARQARPPGDAGAGRAAAKPTRK